MKNLGEKEEKSECNVMVILSNIQWIPDSRVAERVRNY